MKGPLSINELVRFIPTVHKAAADAIGTWEGQKQVRVYHEMKKVTTSTLLDKHHSSPSEVEIR
jgi:hypothetical protein